MEKITFYGQDFTPIADAAVKGHKLEDEIDDGLTYGGLLEQFATQYKIPKEEQNKEQDEDQDEEQDGNSLCFYADKTMFGGWVGVFRSRKFIEETTQKSFDITLEIRCRFDTGNDASFLAAMLLCQTRDKLQFIDAVNITFHQVMDIFLLFIFKNQLSEGAKKGVFRTYQRFERNDSRPHGTIDIARHIRENMGLERGRIAYHYREYTANNPVNRLILAAYKRLCEKYPMLCEQHINRDERVASALKMLQAELGDSKTSVRNIGKETLRPVTHPYFSEYEALRKTCLKIIRDENVSIFDAEECPEETEGLYMDVTKLWEQFLEHHLRKRGLSLTAQSVRPIFAGRNDRTSRPDFVLWQGGAQNCVIATLDAKFKRHWNAFFSGESRASRAVKADINQDINKCIRDMAVFQARRTGVIFPFQKEGEEMSSCYKTYCIGARHDKACRFDMIRVFIPQGTKNFEDWYDKALEPAVDRALKAYLAELKKIADAQAAPHA